MSDNYTQTSTEWYVNWLAENRPDISPEQRLALATGFVQSQQLPTRPAADDDEEQEPTEEEQEELAREQERKSRKYLTSKELAAILDADKNR